MSNKTLLAGMLALGLTACSSAAGRETHANQTNRVSSSQPTLRTLAAGELIEAKIRDSLSSRRSKAGETLTATVTADVADGRGNVVIPRGSPVGLTITQLEPAANQSQAYGKITLAVTSLTVRGHLYQVSGTVDSPPHLLQGASRDVVVKPGTLVVFPLARQLTVSAQ